MCSPNTISISYNDLNRQQITKVFQAKKKMIKIFILTAIFCLIYFGQTNGSSPLEAVTDFPIELNDKLAAELTSVNSSNSTEKKHFTFPRFKNVTLKMINYFNGM